MIEWIRGLQTIDLALLLTLAFAALVALPTARRGGRYRGLPGWVAFHTFFVGLLLAIEHLPGWVGTALLGLLMYFSLRDYFFVAPVRARDRYAVLAAYVSIPFALTMAWAGSNETFLATVPVALFLFIPVFLALGRPQEGMLDSMGRTLLGVMIYVFCAAHLSLLPDVAPGAIGDNGVHGLPQLLGVLILASELPRRLLGGINAGEGWIRPSAALAISLPLVLALGFWLGPECGLSAEDGARAGALVLIAVTLGALVASAVAADLELRASSTRVGRGATLNRIVPAVYAIPVYFHYLNHFA